MLVWHCHAAKPLSENLMSLCHKLIARKFPKRLKNRNCVGKMQGLKFLSECKTFEVADATTHENDLTFYTEEANYNLYFIVRNLGCYHDKTRPLKNIYKNIRNDIDWFDMKKTVMDCAKAAKENGYQV